MKKIKYMGCLRKKKSNMSFILNHYHLVCSQHFIENIVFVKINEGTGQTSNIMILLMISVMAVFSRLPMALQ